MSYDSLREQSKEEEEGESKFVDVPVSLKGHVIGKGGHKLHEIMETTGTTIVSQSKEEAGFTIFGDEDQTAHAEMLIKGIVVKCLKPIVIVKEIVLTVHLRAHTRPIISKYTLCNVMPPSMTSIVN